MIPEAKWAGQEITPLEAETRLRTMIDGFMEHGGEEKDLFALYRVEGQMGRFTLDRSELSRVAMSVMGEYGLSDYRTEEDNSRGTDSDGVSYNKEGARRYLIYPAGEKPYEFVCQMSFLKTEENPETKDLSLMTPIREKWSIRVAIYPETIDSQP